MTKLELLKELDVFDNEDEVFGCVNVVEGYLHKPIHSVDVIEKGQIGLFLNLYWISLESIPEDWKEEFV